MRAAWSTWSHRLAILVGLLVAFWAAVETPAERSFELTMRRFDLTGTILAPLSMGWSTVATLLFSLAAYALVWLVLRLLYRALFEPEDVDVGQ